MKRLFFALWPDPDTRQQCHQLSMSLQVAGKPVVATNLHVTLLFLGALDESKQHAMMQAAGRLFVQPMSLRFDRLDYWRKPAVVCLCTEQVDSTIVSLVDQLTEIATQQHIALDQRPYKPHVTLLRKAKKPPGLEFSPIDWHAKHFCLVESVSTPVGVEYRVLERWGER